MDVTAVRLSLIKRWSIREPIVTSAYLPCISEESPLSTDLQDIITHCCRNNLKLIIDCYANAYHIMWNSTGINPRKHHLFKYLLSIL
jgi:hypothetical protein